MNNLNAFNPLNIVSGGGNKIQHPASGYSSTISHNVEGMHKEFIAFHKNLKNMVMLYKTRHQLMESLNENGLYTAKCYNEMFDATPLSSIVAPGKKHKHAIEDKAAEHDVADPTFSTILKNAPSFGEEGDFVAANRSTQPKSFQEKLASIDDDGIDMVEYPDTTVIREKLEPDEGSRIDKQLSKNIPSQEPEGLKASMKMSMNASKVSNTPRLAHEIGDVVEEKGPAMDPPSANSIISGGSIVEAPKFDRNKSLDPPSKKAFPDDETEVSIEKNRHFENDDSTGNAVDSMGGSVNFIVDDDDDSFTDDRGTKEKLVVEGEKNEGKEVADDIDEEKQARETMVEKAMAAVEKTIEEVKAIVKLPIDTDDDEDEEEFPPFPVISADEPELNCNDEDTRSSGSCPDDERRGGGDKEYLNISSDGELLVVKGKPEPKSQPAALSSKPIMSDCPSYFDIHKAAFKEANSKLDEHSPIVTYVADWEQIVTKRVQSKYFEYGKHRTSLNHYAKKVDQLRAEEEKLTQRGKPMKPKQTEKLERNQLKLTGSEETHDSAGEALLMLMDEVILRSWKDAFPLLNKSIRFEGDFAAISQKHMAKLGGSLEFLDAIGKKESISMEGRLHMFENMNPEDLYTGSRVKHLAGEHHE